MAYCCVCPGPLERGFVIDCGGRLQYTATRTPKPETFRKTAEFLASINQSEVNRWEYPLKVFDRPLKLQK